MMIPICTGCNKSADELEEYIEGAKEAGITIEQYVREEEGTYNPKNGHFLCTDCYVDAGMPSRPYPEQWIAP
jgi:hypothetical protein